MGISSLPTPSEGILTLLLMNTALTISILQQIFRSALNLLGLSPDSSDRTADEEPSMKERFRSKIKPLKLRSGEPHDDCRVCLVPFDSSSVVNRLSCDHVFHKSCFEGWLDYGKDTCPLCRSHVLADEVVVGGGGSSSVELFWVW